MKSSKMGIGTLINKNGKLKEGIAVGVGADERYLKKIYFNNYEVNKKLRK